MGGNVFEVNNKVKSGDLDFILLKPINSQFFISFRYVTTNALISLFILLFLLFRLTYIYHGDQFMVINHVFYFISIIFGIFLLYLYK